MSLLFLLYAEHKHSPKPYTVISAMFSLEVFTSAIHWLSIMATCDSLLSSLPALASLVIKMWLLFLHEKSNWSNLLPRVSRKMHREQTYGFWSRCFSLSLFDQLTWDSTTGSVTADMSQKHEDGLDNLRVRKFNKAWDEHSKSKRPLLWACFYSFQREILLACIAVVAKTILRLAIPFWVEKVISHAQQRAILSQSTSANNTNSLLIPGTFGLLVGWLV